jgi:ABC-type uncharacterized transport system auxiliary subunit
MIAPKIPRRHFLIGAGLSGSLSLSGCGGKLLDIGPPEPGPVYTVLPKPAQGAPQGQGAKVSWALSILQPSAAPGLDSERIALTQPDGTLDFYAKVSYPDRLPPIVQQALLNGFEAKCSLSSACRCSMTSSGARWTWTSRAAMRATRRPVTPTPGRWV